MKEEHKRLHCLTTSLHQKHHAMSLKVAELGEKLVAAETECAELRVRLEEAEYERDKCTGERDKMQSLLVEAREQVKSLQVLCAENQDSQSRNGPHAKNLSTLSQKKLEELQHELEEQRELASGRMAELEKLHANHKEALQTVEKLKMEIKYIPESTIQESVPYKTLQSNFSVLYNEFMNLKTEYDNKCGKLHLTEEEDTKRIALMENEELMCQKKLRAELMQLEDMLAQVRKEYEMLRIEFEQNLAANEQTGPINREMRHLITSLQNHNHQLKGEIQRGKKRHRELSNELAKARKEIEDLRAQVAQQKLGAKKLSADGSSGTLVNSGGANGPGPHDVGSGPSHRDKQPTQQQNCTGDSTPSPVVHVKQESFKSEHPGANSHTCGTLGPIAHFLIEGLLQRHQLGSHPQS
ncbi:unnamed protein product [Darwinula stevensoni]|uniref:E3 ubiquitin protein ligase n=1 Tax=Darwinula stevensoni TaxID=69355 RepID=A0A7R8X7U6_9CRUS|nr:unnamed protein product [Darwinula stevensoni]CAG0880886.1 unnamed protein product [Darwinula stevensoni]